jgi:DNA-binding CsgD family transcriptional regulator
LAEFGRHPRTSWIAWARGLLHEARGDPERALVALEESWTEATALGVVAEYPRLGADLVRQALATGGRDRAVAVTEAVEVIARRMSTPSVLGAALRCRGLVEGDATVLLRAVAVLRESPRPFERAQACAEAAMLVGRAGRLAEARRLFDEAARVYQDLSAQYHLDRMASVMRSLGIRKGKRGTRQRPATGWEALTETELRVVALVAEGMTNTQIAGRLFISHHTVATHLAHIFGKLGIGSRVQLAAEAARPPDSDMARSRDVSPATVPPGC